PKSTSRSVPAIPRDAPGREAGRVVRLRRANADDADTLAALSRETFRQAFGHLYPAEDLQAFFADAYSQQRQRAAITAPGHAVFLLERDGDAVGYAAVGPCGLPHPGVGP